MSSKSTSQEVQRLELAGRLVNYGRQTKSALPLIQAVQIYQQLNVVDDTETANQAPSPFSESQLLSDATKFADGNKTLLSLISDVSKTTRSSGFPGPKRYFGRLEPKGIRYINFNASDGEYIQVVLDGQGDGLSTKDANDDVYAPDWQLTVYDGKMRVIAKDYSRGVNCVACFYSHGSSNMTIEIRNVGELADDYILYIYKK
jgi:hypothetical protein